MPTRLTDIDSIETILGEMTLEEKAALVIGASPFRTKPLARYGIPALVVMDGGSADDEIQRRRDGLRMVAHDHLDPK